MVAKCTKRSLLESIRHQGEVSRRCMGISPERSNESQSTEETIPATAPFEAIKDEKPADHYLSKGSKDHPEGCAGCCRSLVKFGQCKYGQACEDCHVEGCEKRPVRKSKAERKRRRNDEHNPERVEKTDDESTKSLGLKGFTQTEQHLSEPTEESEPDSLLEHELNTMYFGMIT